MQESVSMHKNPTLFKHSRMNQENSEEKEREKNREDPATLIQTDTTEHQNLILNIIFRGHET